LIHPNAHIFKYCPFCGKKELAQAGKKAFSCSACHFKFYLNTAAAGIALIFNQRNELLLTKRRFSPAKGMLDFPGGFAEPGETIEECLMREIKEELNLTITSLYYFCSVPNTYTYQKVCYNITDFAFFCTVDNFDAIVPGDDISDYYFMEPAHIDQNRFGLESPKIILDRLRKKGIPAYLC